MAVKVLVPTALQRYTGNQDEIEVNAETVDQALAALGETYPDIRKHIFSESGQLRQFVNVYVRAADMRQLQGGATALEAGDDVTIVPSIAGGVGEMEHTRAEGTARSSDRLLRYARLITTRE